MKERYLDAVKTKYTSILISGDYVLQELCHCFRAMKGNCELEMHPAWENKEIYVCSRGIPVHRGKPEICGMQCHKTGPGDYDGERVLRVLATTREVIFDPKVCLDSEMEE